MTENGRLSLPPSTGIAWRFVGPYRGGRVMAGVGHPTAKRVFYFGTSGGGVWKTVDGGTLWRNVSDGYFKRASVGSLAIAETDPNVIYTGMGECSLRSNITYGDGVYKSLDGGETWRDMGLAETHNIARMRIHPHDANVVYVAAFGHRFGPNDERGVYRSPDGGETWERVLHRNANTGAIDLSLDASNPRILYAALWDAQLFPWGRKNGGPGSGIFRSTDGGDSWTELTENPGLPSGTKGRIGISASPAGSGRVWAIVDAIEGGGIYRSDDGGASWGWLNDDRNFLVRPWYFGRIEADPLDPDTVYVVNRKLWKSVDGGRTFAQVNVPYVDQQDLWIDPRDPQRMILGNDGGSSVSFDGGETWSSIVNQPTAELYHTAADNHFPYRIYGSQQDNSTLALPHRSDRGPISQMDWYDVGGGESGFIAVRPDNPNIVYSSDLPGLGVTRYDHATRQIREIAPWHEPGAREDGSLRYRFNWSTPVVLSPHDPDTVYIAGNYLFRSRDEGNSWEEISPDLTRNDPEYIHLPNGRNPWADSESSHPCTISSVAESPVERGVIWVGSDDGLVHVSRDDGATWTNVTPPEMPEWSMTQVEPSAHDAGIAWIAASAHATDDFRPCVFRTDDFGQTWTLVASGIPDGEFVRVVREDPERPELLYAGTEAGLHVSFNGGDSWLSMQLNLPVVAVYDLIVKGSDLIVATHGRGLWVLDDLSPIRELTTDALGSPAHLCRPRPVYRVAREVYRLDSLIALYGTYAAENPPSGIVVTYFLRDAVNRVSITLAERDGTVISTSASVVPDKASQEPIGPLRYRLRGGAAVLTGTVPGEPEPGVRWGAVTLPAPGVVGASTSPGLHRIAIPIVHPGARPVPGVAPRGFTSPILVPGSYLVHLDVEGQRYTEQVEIRPDPRIETTPEEYQAQIDLLLRIRDKVSEIHDAVNFIAALRAQVDALLLLAGGRENTTGLVASVTTLLGALNEIEAALIQRGLHQHSGELDSIHFPIRLNAKLETLGFTIARSDTAPTQQAYRQFDDLAARADAYLARLAEVFDRDLPAFNAAASAAGLGQIRVEGSEPS